MSNMISYILFFLVTFIIPSLGIWGLSGLIQYFIPTPLIIRLRKSLVDVTFFTSAALGVMIAWSLHETQFFTQQYILIIGSIVLFLLSSVIKFVEKKIILCTAIWCVVCLVWVFLRPIS